MKSINKIPSPKLELVYETYKKGDAVLMRNASNRCTTRYKTGKVTRVLILQTVLVDGKTSAPFSM